MWNEEIEQDFIALKKAFTECGIQAFPDFGVGDLFVLTTMEQGEYSGSVVSGPGRTGEIPLVLGKKM